LGLSGSPPFLFFFAAFVDIKELGVKVEQGMSNDAGGDNENVVGFENLGRER
jgi:hypothetical protein